MSAKEVHKKFLDRAYQEKGVAEIPGPRDNEKIIKYHKFTSLKASDDETPWCSSFVNYIVAQCGYTGTNSAAARSWLKWGKEVKYNDVFPGCIAINWRGKPDGWQGHVYFVEKIIGDKIYGWGGNQNNKVCRQIYRKSQLLGFRSIYSDDKPNTVPDKKPETQPEQTQKISFWQRIKNFFAKMLG